MFKGEHKPPIKLTVVRASNLPAGDFMGNADPYVVVQVEGREEIFKTPVRNRTLDPQWGDEGKIEITDYERGDAIKFMIMDKDRFTKDDELGTARLSHDYWGHPNGFDGDIKIVVEKAAKKAWLRLKVEPLPEIAAPMCNLCTIQ